MILALGLIHPEIKQVQGVDDGHAAQLAGFGINLLDELFGGFQKFGHIGFGKQDFELDKSVKNLGQFA